MPTPMDPTAAAFMLVENRNQPMHVGVLQLFRPPADADGTFIRDLYQSMLAVDEIAPLYIKRPFRSAATGGLWTWKEDDEFDIEHHVRHGALPEPGRVRELLELCSRLHGTRLAPERPLWEATLIEGLRDGRMALYTKMHHSLIDGVSSMRLLQSVLSTDPDRRGMPPPWGTPPPARTTTPTPVSVDRVSLSALRSGLGISADAAGLPGALVRTLNRGVRNETSALSFYAPRTILNTTITGSRRFAAQDWPIDRLRGIGRPTGTTINDVVLAMVSGAMRRYLAELDALPDSTLVAMVPVGLNAKQSHNSSAEGGNAVGTVMVKLGTDLADPAQRLTAIHRSMRDGKEALTTMTPLQIVALSGIGLAPAVLPPLLKMSGITRPPFNLVVSNVPGPKVPHYYNGAEMVGMYPLSIPIHGMALNITCMSYAGNLGFGLTGCRRTVPHLQRLLTHLDDELAALEQAAGV
jgi:diacylglycerol O-acyltransferase / wax synthase